ncbi:response regulator [Thiovibrio sp. JS02]
MRFPIGKKIFISHLALVSIATALLSLASYFFMARLFNDSQNEQMRILASTTASAVAGRVEKHADLLKEIAEAPEVRRYAEKYQELFLAKHLARHKDQFSYLSYVDEQGHEEVSSLGGELFSVLRDHSTSRIFQESLAAPNRTHLAGVVFEPVLQRHVVRFSYVNQGYFGDRFQGMILAHADLEAFVGPCGNCSMQKKGTCIVVDQDGTILTDLGGKEAAPSLTLADTDIASLLAAAERNDPSPPRQGVFQGVESVFTLAPVENTTWSVLFVLPLADYTAVPRLIRNLSLLILSGLVILASISTYFITQGITTPIHKLVMASEAMAKGIFDQKVEAENDEIGDLALSFNSMAEKLNNSINREKQLLAAEASARLAAELADQHKTEFLSRMSHEFRTPLSIVIGMAELLLHGGLDEKERENALSIQEAGRDLLNLIDGILDFSRLENGTMQLSKAPFDLYRMLEKLKLKYLPAARHKGLDLYYIEPVAVPRMVYGDVSRIFQIFENLLDNAIKFTEQGEVVIRIRPLGFFSSDNGAQIIQLRFEVTDTGCGIPLDQQSAMFESFRQMGPYSTRKMRGLGLGLSLARHLADLMDGSLGMKSDPGKGSTFFVDLKLPVVLEGAGELFPQTGQGSPEETGNSACPLKKLRVLVVEDNPINQKFLRLMLQILGHQVIMVADGKEAVAAFKSEAVDLILMDVQMPGMNGFEATGLIREIEAAEGRHVPIIAVTAHALPGYREKCLKAGMDSYLAKPFRMHDLCAAIRESVA